MALTGLLPITKGSQSSEEGGPKAPPIQCQVDYKPGSLESFSRQTSAENSTYSRGEAKETPLIAAASQETKKPIRAMRGRQTWARWQAYDKQRETYTNWADSESVARREARIAAKPVAK